MRGTMIMISGALSDPRPLFHPLCRALDGIAGTRLLSWAVASHPDPAAGYCIDDELRQVEHAAGAAPVHLLGASGGCTGALLFALRHPGQVASLTLAEPGWLGTTTWWDGEEGLVAEFTRLAGLPDEQLFSTFAAMIAQSPAPGRRPEVPARVLARQAAELRAVWTTWPRQELDISLLGRVNAPVYLPVGELSPERSHAAARFLAGIAPRAEVEVIAGRRHQNLMQAPEIIAGVRRAVARAGIRVGARPPAPRIAPLSDDELSHLPASLLAALPHHNANILRTFLRAPGLIPVWAPFSLKLLDGAIPARDRELLILRTARNCRSEYEWGQHQILAGPAGLTDAEIVRIATEPPESWPHWEAALLRAADELHADSCIADLTWAELSARYDSEQLIEATLVVGYYHALAQVINSLGIQLDAGLSGFPQP